MKQSTTLWTRLTPQHPDPNQAIKFRMEQQGMTRKDLEAMIGTRT
ncbi:MAG: hypothetical protein RL367_212, partial [Pseudomonadota bacterium]